MMALMLVGLAAGCAVMWQRVIALEARLTALEMGGYPFGRSWEAERAWDQFDVPEAAPAPAPPPSTPIDPLPVVDPVAPLPEPSVALVPRRRFGFEDIFGRYLPIWAGGITLAVAGFLIVKYSIDAGLLSPTIRVVLGLLFGSGLIAGAELALRRDDIARDPRIRQALSGAGIATLYASVLVAANHYHLIDPTTAFGGLSIVTAMAGLLSTRFGAPSAVLGLIGGMAAPALVGATEPDVPLLAFWLALTVGGLTVLGRRQRWWWLGALAVTGGFGWGLVLIAAGLHSVASALSVGTLTLLLAIGFPLAIAGAQGGAVRIVALFAGCAQMAAIVATGGFAPLDWGLFGLLSVAAIWLSRHEPMLADAPIGALPLGILLAAVWPHPSGSALAMVLGGGALIYGAPALLRLWRDTGRLGDAVQLAAIGVAVALVPAAHFWWQLPRADFAPLALIGAAVTGAAAALGWRKPQRVDDARFAIVAVSTIALAGLAAVLAVPVWAMAPVVIAAGLVALLLGRATEDARIDTAAQVLATGAIALLIGHDPDELARAIGFAVPAAPVTAFVRWAIGAVVLAGFARWSLVDASRRAGEAATTLALYVAAAQIVPAAWLALVPVALLGALALAGKRAPLPALMAALLLVIGWALEPLERWSSAGAISLVGLPYAVDMAPALGVTLLRIAAPAVALTLLFARGAVPARSRMPIAAAATVLATVAAHVLWKQVFAISNAIEFTAYGMAERTLWEALLLGAAIAAWQARGRTIAIGLGAAALLHFGWYTLLLHDPLWSKQAAGPWLIPAYGIAFAIVWLSRYVVPAASHARDFVRMPLILLLAVSLLRQAFHGSMLSETGVTAAEDIGRSLLAIALAIGFLQWGIQRARRNWRIVSLALMLGAVGKVFLFDAAGLDGLLRIASFAALGFSLIGVGWLYSRYLPDAARDTTLTDESLSADTYPADIRG